MNDLFRRLLAPSSTATTTGRGRRWSPPTTTRRSHDDEAGWSEGVVFVCKGCDEQVRVRHREDRTRPAGATPTTHGSRRSAAEAADHVVEDRQSPAQRLDRDALVDAVEALEEALVGIEPERREAVGRDARAVAVCLASVANGTITGSGMPSGSWSRMRRDRAGRRAARRRGLDRAPRRRSARARRPPRAPARAGRAARRACRARSCPAGAGSRPRPWRRPG